MSLHTNFHAPRTTLSWRIQIGHKSGFIIYYFISSVNIKPPRHRFGLSLCPGLAIMYSIFTTPYWTCPLTFKRPGLGPRFELFQIGETKEWQQSKLLNKYCWDKLKMVIPKLQHQSILIWMFCSYFESEYDQAFQKLWLDSTYKHTNWNICRGEKKAKLVQL